MLSNGIQVGIAFVVLQLFRFKVCGIAGISKIEFSNFPGTELI